MANDALKELESLAGLGEQGRTEAANLQSLRESRRTFDRVPEDGEDAGFALPEALATAVGVGWLLGPVGGILMGAAQGILGKQEKQSAIDRYARDSGILGDTNDVFNGELDRLSMTTQNPNDLEQLSTMQTQKDAAMRLMSSSSPELQQQGSAMLSDFSSRLNDYSVNQELQQVEADAFDAQMKRDLDASQESSYRSSIDNFRAESRGYEDIMLATDTALDALANGTPASLWASGILINKALDSNGVVTESGVKSLGVMNGLWGKAKTLMERAKSGKVMLPKQRKELSNLLYSLRQTNTEYQLAREACYIDEAFDVGLPTRYIDNFQLADQVPAASPGNIDTPTLPSRDLKNVITDKVKGLGAGEALEKNTLFSGIRSWFGKEVDARDENLKKQRSEL